jgi:hypothetical protein
LAHLQVPRPSHVLCSQQVVRWVMRQATLR